jgi:hypothetical protein
MVILSFLSHFIKNLLGQALIIPIGIIFLLIAIPIEEWIRKQIKKHKDKKNENQ